MEAGDSETLELRLHPDPANNNQQQQPDPGTQITDLLSNEYYMYYKHEMSGPYNAHELFRLYISGRIHRQVWIKRITDWEQHDKWCPLVLSANEAENEQLRRLFPQVFAYLVPKLKVPQTALPVDIPQAALGSLSCSQVVVQLFGWLISGIVAVFVFLHLCLTVLLTYFCVELPEQCDCCRCDCCCKNITDEQMLKLKWCLAVTGYVIIPPVIVYAVLLDAVNLEHWQGEIQSYMIAYIAWGAFAFVIMVTLISILGSSPLSRSAARKFLEFMFWLTGVDFDGIDSQTIKEKKFVGVALFLFPTLAALLPAVIIGFIANFVLQERFELNCDADVENHALCYAEYGCCEVISSHDAYTVFYFIGGLASNILASWAVIRFIGYLMVHVSPEISMFAKRNDVYTVI